MSRIYFKHQENKQIYDLFNKLDGSQSIGHHFEMFLEIAVYSLARDDDRYLETINKLSRKDDIHIFVKIFASVINAMEVTGSDILGDFYEGCITFGEKGQFFTPNNITDMMAEMVGCENNKFGKVVDPCCGSGRMLLSASKKNPHQYFMGKDLDKRCVYMTGINLALYNLYGEVLLGNGLTDKWDLKLNTGFNGYSFIKIIANKTKN